MVREPSVKLLVSFERASVKHRWWFLLPNVASLLASTLKRLVSRPQGQTSLANSGTEKSVLFGDTTETRGQ
jgi:hypothetical protein